MYLELKSGHGDRGLACIARVGFSKSGKTVYHRGLKLRRLKGGGASGNYYDIETGDEYWVSGPKSNGRDRHWAGSGPVEIDVDARREYWTEIREQPERVNEKFA